MRTFCLLCSLSQLSYPFLGPALPKQMGNWRDGEKKTPQSIKHKPPNKGDKSSFFFSVQVVLLLPQVSVFSAVGK